MKFGPVPVSEAHGALAAHAIRLPDGVIKKGVVLGPSELARLAQAGIGEVVAARLDPGDVAEDDAARRLASAIAGEGARIDRPFTGRCNLFAERAGLLVIDRAAVDKINMVDEAVTVATLAPFKSVAPGEMIATVKIIPFAVPDSLLQAALTGAGRAALSVAAWRAMKLGVVSTTSPGLKPSVIRKTLDVLAGRVAIAGASIAREQVVAHDVQALARALTALAASESELLVVFGASAITDRRDIVPAAIAQAGGVVTHFGMPVDPGNLLLIGEIAGKPVLGAPGCARSPKENGFDWVLRRYLAGLGVSRADIAGLGVGGLLMEIVQRGQPRQATPDKEGEAP